jgi:NADH dehydrogenase
VILLTGASGTVGKALLPLLLGRGDQVRVLVRDPRRLGRHRVDVQLALGDLGGLADARLRRQAFRGVDTVIHLAASIRDSTGGSVEEVNALGTARVLSAAEAAGVERLVFFSAIGASPFQRTRFFRAKALAEEGVRASALPTSVLAPSIVYDRDDPWITLMRRLTLLPLLPISGSGRARFQPIWAGDVAQCVLGVLDAAELPGRVELAGPETLSYDQIARLIARVNGRQRRLLHVPLNLVRMSLNAARRIAGDAVFATWEEAELMEIPMVSAAGPAGPRSLGVEPARMADVLAAPR